MLLKHGWKFYCCFLNILRATVCGYVGCNVQLQNTMWTYLPPIPNLDLSKTEALITMTINILSLRSINLSFG